MRYYVVSVDSSGEIRLMLRSQRHVSCGGLLTRCCRGRGRAPPVSDINAGQFHRYFNDKVADVRSETANAPPPSYRLVPDVSFLQFQQVCPEEVAAVIRALPDKSCALDPLPTTQLKAAADVVVPFLTELLNRSLSYRSFPDVFTET